jgi:hypothetical protein
VKVRDPNCVRILKRMLSQPVELVKFQHRRLKSGGEAHESNGRVRPFDGLSRSEPENPPEFVHRRTQTG